MRNLFKTVAKEGLIDQAGQVNENEKTDSPQALQSAADFDAELKKLKAAEGDGDQTNTPTDVPAPASTEDTPKPADGGGDTPKPDADGQEGKNDDDDDDDKDDDDDSDPADAVDPVKPNAPLEKAAEAFKRVTRVYQTIMRGYSHGVVSVEAMALAHNELNVVSRDMDLTVPLAPAREHLIISSESGRMADFKDRVVAFLKALWEKFLEWLEKIVNFIGGARKSYDARKGIYDKTADGYSKRLKAIEGVVIKGDFKELSKDTDFQLEVNLGPLAHYGPLRGIEGFTESIKTTLSLAGPIADACDATHAHEKLQNIINVVKGMQSQPVGALAGRIEGYDLEVLFKATHTSSIFGKSNGSLSHHLETNGNGSGVITVGHLPGGKAMHWNYGKASGYATLAEAATEIGKVNFRLDKDADREPDFKDETLVVNVEVLNQLLDIHKNVSREMADISTAINDANAALNSIHTHTKTMVKVLEEVISPSADWDVQDAARVFTLIASAFEKAFVRPLTEIATMVGQSDKKLLDIVGAGLAKFDAKMKPDPKAKKA